MKVFATPAHEQCSSVSSSQILSRREIKSEHSIEQEELFPSYGILIVVVLTSTTDEEKSAWMVMKRSNCVAVVVWDCCVMLSFPVQHFIGVVQDGEKSMPPSSPVIQISFSSSVCCCCSL